jgi:hypothetical protein
MILRRSAGIPELLASAPSDRLQFELELAGNEAATVEPRLHWQQRTDAPGRQQQLDPERQLHEVAHEIDRVVSFLLVVPLFGVRLNPTFSATRNRVAAHLLGAPWIFESGSSRSDYRRGVCR